MKFPSARLQGVYISDGVSGRYHEIVVPAEDYHCLLAIVQEHGYKPFEKGAGGRSVQLGHGLRRREFLVPESLAQGLEQRYPTRQQVRSAYWQDTSLPGSIIDAVRRRINPDYRIDGKTAAAAETYICHPRHADNAPVVSRQPAPTGTTVAYRQHRPGERAPSDTDTHNFATWFLAGAGVFASSLAILWAQQLFGEVTYTPRAPSPPTTSALPDGHGSILYVPVTREVLSGDTVWDYWRQSQPSGHVIRSWDAYQNQVQGLNPDIHNLDEIQAGQTIVLPLPQHQRGTLDRQR
ncbi:MAG: hypothetical protein HYY37_04210 [Candidatus Aenigmarchaeota archaeon]|nr:hypothetical protein [Candidatus Aenigmarchaeota archaeon]